MAPIYPGPDELNLNMQNIWLGVAGSSPLSEPPTEIVDAFSCLVMHAGKCVIDAEASCMKYCARAMRDFVTK